MAKLFKISAYIVDPNDEFSEDYLRDDLEYCHDIHMRHLKVEGTDIGEWDDNLAINRINCGIEEFKKYFEVNNG